MILDVAHLVARHTFELLAVHDLDQSGREGNGRLIRTDSRGEGVGRRILNHVDVGFGDAFTDSQGVDEIMQLLVANWIGGHGSRDP